MPISAARKRNRPSKPFLSRSKTPWAADSASNCAASASSACAPQDGHWPQPPHRRGSQYSSRKSRALQARQGIARHRGNTNREQVVLLRSHPRSCRCTGRRRYVHAASALPLLTILLAHELGHFFACRHHHIRSSYPLFIPFPSLIGTFGAFILIRSAIRTRRALFDVGASGPLVGFVFAIPALVYGVIHAKFVPGIANADKVEFVFGVPLAVKLTTMLVHPRVPANLLLLDPVGRAAWVGLFATSLNLLPSGQLDGGHILRSVSTRLHWIISWLLPLLLVALGFFLHWSGWFIWAGMLFALRFLRLPPIYDATPLDRTRRWIALIALIVFLLSFMPAPVLSSY